MLTTVERVMDDHVADGAVIPFDWFGSRTAYAIAAARVVVDQIIQRVDMVVPVAHLDGQSISGSRGAIASATASTPYSMWRSIPLTNVS